VVVHHFGMASRDFIRKLLEIYSRQSDGTLDCAKQVKCSFCSLSTMMIGEFRKLLEYRVLP